MIVVVAGIGAGVGAGVRRVERARAATGRVLTAPIHAVSWSTAVVLAAACGPAVV